MLVLQHIILFTEAIGHSCLPLNDRSQVAPNYCDFFQAQCNPNTKFPVELHKIICFSLYINVVSLLKFSCTMPRLPF